MKGKTIFKGKNCKLVTDNGFVIYGIVKDIDDVGFLFETTTATSYYTWDNITSIVISNGGN